MRWNPHKNRPDKDPPKGKPDNKPATTSKASVNQLSSNGHVVLTGDASGAYRLDGVKNAVLDLGGHTLDVGKKSEFALFLNNCRKLSIVNGTVRRGQLAIFLQHCQEIAVSHVKMQDQKQTGLLTNFCDDLIFEDLEAFDQDDEHGVYISDGTKGVIGRRIRCYRNGQGDRSVSFQINGADTSKPGNLSVKDLLLEDLDLGPNPGGAALSIYAVAGAKFVRTKIRDAATAVIIADGGKKGCGPTGVEFINPSIQGDIRVVGGVARPKGL